MADKLKYKLRSFIRAEKGNLLIQADFSQGETWIVAHLSEDPLMIKYISTGDIHSETGFAIHRTKDTPLCLEHKWKANDLGGKTCVNCNFILDYEQRTLGKQSNHGLSYRMSYLKWAQLQNKNGVRISNQRAKAIKEIWTNLYPGVPRWWAEIERELDRNNRTLINPYGRERTFYQQWGEELFKEATAYKPQSGLADHANGMIHPELGIPGGFLEVHKQLGNGKPGWIINASHDSIILETPEKEAEWVGGRVREILMRPLVVNGHQFTIPVDIEIGERWGEWN